MSKKSFRIFSGIIFFAVFFLAENFLFAQELLTLDEAVKIALEKNFSIRIARNQQQIAENNVTPGNAGFLPRLDATGNYSYGRNNILQKNSSGAVTRDIPGAEAKNLGAGLALNWTLFDGFMMFTNYKLQKQFEESGELNTMLQVENTVARVVAAYFDIVRQQQLLEAQRSALGISQERLRIAAAKSEIGAGSGLAELQARVDLNADSARLLAQEISLSNAKNQLLLAIGENQNKNFSVSGTISADTTLEKYSLQELALNQNFLLRMAENNEEISRLNLENVAALWYPRLSLNSGYNFTQAQSPGGFTAFNQNTGWTTGLSASINILDFNTGRQYENAKIQIENSRLQIDSLRNRIELNLDQSYKNYRANLRLTNIEEQNVALAQRSADIALQRFRLGSTTALELREAQNAFVEAQTRLVNARYNLKSAETELLRLSGQILRRNQ